MAGHAREILLSVQTDALLRKNLTFQKRNKRENCCLVLFPLVLILILFIIQVFIDNQLDKPEFRCPKGGVEDADLANFMWCAIEHPNQWPAFYLVPWIPFRATPNGQQNDTAMILVTSENATVSTVLAKNIFNDTAMNEALLTLIEGSSTDLYDSLAHSSLGSSAYIGYNFYIDPAGYVEEDDHGIDYNFRESGTMYFLANDCSSFDSDVLNVMDNVYNILYPMQTNGMNYSQCLNVVFENEDSTDSLEETLFDGFMRDNLNKDINEYVGAFDFRDTDIQKNVLRVDLYYNNTAYDQGGGGGPPLLMRINAPLNSATQAYLSAVMGPEYSVKLRSLKEMPKIESRLRLDFSSLIGPMIYLWIFYLMFPVIVGALLYEKENRLRLMMKMNGLASKPYWLVTYFYFFCVYFLYMLLVVIFGSLIGLGFFLENSYGVQFVFYFAAIHQTIAFAFLCSTLFDSYKTATVCAYLYTFGSGLLGSSLIQFYFEDASTPEGGVFVIHIIPAFGVFRGLYEFGEGAFMAGYENGGGVTFASLYEDPRNQMDDVMWIMLVEWFIFLVLTWYFGEVLEDGTGVRKHPLFFLGKYNPYHKNVHALDQATRGAEVELQTMDEGELEDVMHERDRAYREDAPDNSAILCRSLRKVYPPRAGGKKHVAVKNLSMSIGKTECFGLLGPNGAGKTTTITMLCGFQAPTSGQAIIAGLDVAEDMDLIHSNIGVCPQHDLLWGTLTPREHLLFYARLKGLRGQELEDSVRDALKSVNLLGVQNKQVGQFSGGMKRRLSVAIAIIGRPAVVFLDEPSTGLDPASRRSLWQAITASKKDSAIILTTHSMEEAEALCDRLGIFVDGGLQCVGSPKELTRRFGGYFLLTITTPPENVADAEAFVYSLAPEAKRTYYLAGTQKFELPTQRTRLEVVFHAMETNRTRLQIRDWGLVNTTLEEVFIKIAAKKDKRPSMDTSQRGHPAAGPSGGVQSDPSAGAASSSHVPYNPTSRQ
eukprot:TRINITY_DN2875_c1_g1::TRINITY_DN2875_c1_g1_i2::g.6040::m.6040 TRINITY_DN2875_c1_g1::TRINITY_DN2875_c1_g1_i2::g.6040  ORF type:complete len:991 (-),score=211.47,sp/Q8LPK0/AB8A_ARATH/42.77/0.0,ABC_tran/PF00005.22/1.5e-26,ABC2_membrane_3/PF12698.2/2.6e-14,AAA_21/PF13304.1/0.15,AAA_21/PF13304.1/1.5e-10,ABC2_membrane_4/PF12730.2/7.4e+02,ABC2_membrane_4/PF12730.2/0.00054,SMC_N/PF02463.14/0.0059,IstB_IS21/PF01695.12/14,IstB_IS21/PF01695.12/20,SRP54/PF00448.17/0.33,AAA_23/PF13476.1/8.1e+03,AAA_23/PF1347